VNRCFRFPWLPDVHAQARWARLPGAESGARCARACSPWSAPFPPPPPQPVPGPCSAASAVLRSGPTSRARPSSPYVLKLRDAALVCAKAGTGPPGSQTRCVRTCSGSQTAQGSGPSGESDGLDIAFRLFSQRQHPGGERISRLNTRPMRPPVNASPSSLRARGA
jgi:hypothetical protein